MKRFWTGLLSAALLLSGLSGCGAGTSAVQTVTSGLEDFSAEISFRSRDVDATLNQVFEEKPELYYYFGRYNDQSQREGNKVTLCMEYINTDSAASQVFVVDSAETLSYVMGLALAETMEEVAMVITDSTITTDDITDAIEQWRDDNYLIYMGYSGATSTTASTSVSSWISCRVELSYVAATDEIQRWRQETEDEVVRLSESLFALDMPEYQRELLIHDYLVNYTTCEETASSDASYTAYGALVNHSAVCEGYAEAAHILFQAAGLEDYYVEGAGNSSNHAWNCVRVDEEWYWVDVTWDDTKGADGTESLSHNYFNLTDSQLNEDHSWQAASYPTCTSTTWKYDAVQAALEESSTDGTSTDGTDETTADSSASTGTFNTYSSRNVVLIEDQKYTLITSLGMSQEDYDSATTPLLDYQLKSAAALTTAALEESGTTSSAAADSTASAEPAESQSAETTSPTTAVTQTTQTQTTQSEKSGGHLLRNVLLVIVILLAVLVVGYLIYRRAMYRRMLRRRRARDRARRRAAQQGRPAGQSRGGSGRSSASSGKKRPRSASSRPRSGSSRPRSSSSRSGSGSGSGSSRRRRNPFQ